MFKKSTEVFGVSTEILKDSYVDRGDLDSKIESYLERDNHIAIRGASKSGKSWLRQRILNDPIKIQCRLEKTVTDIYREALGQLGVKLETSATKSSTLEGAVEAETELGINLIGKVKAKLGFSGAKTSETTTEKLRQNINDLDFVCELIKESGRRLVIEDFHYLDQAERQKFSFDMKSMWDLGLYIVVVGVWSDNNLLLHLNPDLTGRVREVPVIWTDPDLRKILDRGCAALNVHMSHEVREKLVDISYGNAGILQRITIDTLDHAGIYERKLTSQQVTDVGHVEAAAMFYAEELNTVYQKFAQNVANGIRRRNNATGIYAHAMAAVLDEPDEKLIAGIPQQDIYAVAHAREDRIKRGNLTTALGNIERLQVDSDGRGLVLSYAEGRVRVVDHQLLLYRRFATVRWPWEDMIAEADASGEEDRYTATSDAAADNPATDG
ncbi:hypothetical protein A7U43_13180 [Mycobacterium adipatum]|uniref:Uncharacterized protein n=1 Tax=Mycobacterium adipatum TaxID=1682113 RepID=A0A172UUP8_9MYCO|nr:hypothetical protein [Mycobacterium adipatum]ANE82879.1 hypothetical protein A7U43_13180 [Mycobacterium adipatum]